MVEYSDLASSGLGRVFVLFIRDVKIIHLESFFEFDIVEQHARVKDVVGNNSSRHWSPVQSEKISFGRNDVSGPAASKLYGTVNASHDDENNYPDRSEDEKTHALACLEGRDMQFRCCPVDYVGEETAEDNHRGQLEVDTCDHDVCANFRVALWGFVECDGS